MTIGIAVQSGRMIFSHVQTNPLLKRRKSLPTTVEMSADLNQTTQSFQLDTDGLHLSEDSVLTWAQIKKIGKSENNCFELYEGELDKVVAFSEVTNRYYSLYPTKLAPTMLVAGFPMHRIKNTNPYQDTLEKIKAVTLVTGNCLDTCTGLGYTAIQMARSAEKVTTIELDPGAQEICRANPWSRDLFENPKINQLIGDCYDLVPEFGDGEFGRIIHDPPTFSLGGHLYSRDFYAQLYRILSQGGKLFHYIGDPESRSGRNITRGVVERLKAVGFKRITRQPKAFGVLARK